MTADTEETPEPLKHARAAARPLMLRTGVEGAPVAVYGTSFLIARKGNFFVVTAAHLIRDAHSETVFVLPSDYALDGLSLSNGFQIEPDPADSADEYDAIVYKASVQGVPKNVAEASHAFRLDYPIAWDWMPNSYTAIFFLMGHPAEINEVDYEAGLVKTAQVLLTGRYLGSAEGQSTLHRLKVENPLNLQHFRGLSGAPVVSFERRLFSEPVMRFCGIAIWGSVESKLIHFLEARIIVHLLDSAAAHWDLANQ